MSDNEYTTKIKIAADTSGGEKSVKSLEGVEKKALGLQKAVGGVTNAVSLMRRALVGFGVVSLFTSIIGAVENLRKKFGEATVEADKLKEANEKAADKKRVEELTVAYDNLAKSIAASSKERERANELEDMALSSARELEDIDAQAAKDAELAALDPTDRYYEQKKAQIEAKYSGQAANRAAQRKVEDAERTAARTAAEAEAKGEEAGLRRGALSDDRSQLDILKERRARAIVESKGGNDITGGTQLWTDFTRLFGMNGGWGKFGSYTTEEGDAKRKEAEARAKELESQIKAKEKDIAEKERKIAELEEEAAYLSKKSVIQSGMAENAKDMASVTRAQGLRSEQAASAALSSKLESDIDAARAKALLEKQIPETERQIYLQKQRIAAADASVAAAQADYDNATGSDKGRAAARLAQVKKEAEQVRDESNRYIQAISESLQGMKSALSQTVNILKKNNSQRLTEQAQQYVAQ